jgi:pimeloyl-ACP methyl ester carboxylesterase
LDVPEVLKHVGWEGAEDTTFVAWSMGTQIALQVCSTLMEQEKGETKALGQRQRRPRLFLLNPGTGKCLHTMFQPFARLPSQMGDAISATVKAIGRFILVPLCQSPVWAWPIVRSICLSRPLFCVLSGVSFVLGFPPEAQSYWSVYLRDFLQSRAATVALLDHIKGLDHALPDEALCLPHDACIVVSMTDPCTGWYQGRDLHCRMPNSGPGLHTSWFGSHFLLMEFPEWTAGLITDFLAAAN